MAINVSSACNHRIKLISKKFAQKNTKKNLKYQNVESNFQEKGSYFVDVVKHEKSFKMTLMLKSYHLPHRGRWRQKNLESSMASC